MENLFSIKKEKKTFFCFSTFHHNTEQAYQYFGWEYSSLGYKSKILVSLDVLMTKRHHFWAVKLSFRVQSKTLSP